MTLREAVDRYVALRQAGGADFRATASVLATFCRAVGENRRRRRHPSRPRPYLRERYRPAHAVLASEVLCAPRVLSLRDRAALGGADTVARHNTE